MLDAKLIFSDAQAISSADVVSTNVIDVGVYETALGEEEHLRLEVWIAEAMVNAADDATLSFELTDCATEGGSYLLLAVSKAFIASEMTLGKKIFDIGLPCSHKRYLRLNYQYTAGTGTLVGKCNAFITAR